MASDTKALLKIDWQGATVSQIHNLLANGAKANVYNEDGWTPLMKACSDRAPLSVIKTLVLDGKACVNAANPHNGITALMLACRSHSSRAVRFLLAQEADSDAIDKWGWSPMRYAVCQNNPSNIRCLRAHSHERQRD